MIVQYTPISTLSQAELTALKNATRDLRLESVGPHFAFMGKTFSIGELQAQQRTWENGTKVGGQQLNG